MSVYTGRTLSCTRAIHTGRVTDRVHGLSCTRHVHGRVHGPKRPYAAVYRAHSRPPCRTAVTRPYTWVYTAVTQPCTRRLHSRVHGQYIHVRVHEPCRRPGTRPVVYMAGKPTRPCTRPLRGRVRATYMYTARCVHAGTRPCTLAERTRTRPCMRHVEGRKRRPCTRPCVHGPYTAVYTANTRPCNGRVHVVYPAMYTAVYAPCTRPKTAVYRARTLSCTRPVYTGRVHGMYTRRHWRYTYTARARPYNATVIMIHSGRGQLTTRAPSSGQQQQPVLFLRSSATCLFSTRYTGNTKHDLDDVGYRPRYVTRFVANG